MPDPTSLLQTPPFLAPQDAANAYGTGAIINPTQPQADNTTPAPAPGDTLEDFIKKNATKTYGDFLKQRMGIDDAAVNARKQSGKSELGHRLGVLAQMIMGRNYQNEAQKDYDSTQGALKNVIGELKNQQVANIAAAKIAEADQLRQDKLALGQQLNSIKQQEANQKGQRNNDLKELRSRQLDLAEQLNQGKITLQEAQAKHQAEVDKFLEKNGGLKGDDALIYQMATAGTPEAQKLQQAFMTAQAAKSLGHVLPTGTGRVTTQSLDNSGNTVTSTSSQRQFASPGLQFLQGILQGTPANNLGGAVIQTGGGNAAPAARPVVKPPVSPPSPETPANINTTAYVPGVPADWMKAAFQGVPNIKENQQMRADTDKIVKGINGVAAQRANLQDAILNGDAAKFNGIVQGLPTTQKLRAMIGTVTPNEALSKPLNYDALFGKLGTSVKGSYRNSEISKAMESLGKDVNNPWNTLATHAANELMLQAAAADRSKQFANKGVTPEEETRAAQQEIARYVNAIGKASTVPGYAKTHQNELRLKTIQEAIDDDRARQKAQGKTAPTDKKDINAMSDPELLDYYRKLSQTAGAK